MYKYFFVPKYLYICSRKQTTHYYEKLNFLWLMLMCIYSFSQVGIDTETPNDAAILDIVSNEK